MDNSKIKLKLNFLHENLEPEMVNLINDYWANDGNTFSNTLKSLIQKYAQYGKSSSVFENKMKHLVEVQKEETCCKCSEPILSVVSKRQDFNKNLYYWSSRKCEKCLVVEKTVEEYKSKQKTKEFDRLKSESIQHLADTFNENAIQNLNERELKFLQIVNDHQSESLQGGLYSKLVKSGIHMDNAYFHMVHQLNELNIIRHHRGNKERKGYIFIHPETMLFINNQNQQTPDCVLLRYLKRYSYDPDFTGSFSVRKEFALNIGQQVSLTLKAEESRITLEILERTSDPAYIRDIIPHTFKVKTPLIINHSNFLHVNLDQQYDVRMPIKTKYRFIAKHPVVFKPLVRMRAAIWVRDQHLKLKIEPTDLPMIHGDTGLVN